MIKSYINIYKKYFNNDYFIDLTKDHITIVKSPDNILLDSDFKNLSLNNYYSNTTELRNNTFKRFFLNNSFSKYNNIFFTSFPGLSLSLFIHSLQTIKTNSNGSFVRPRIIISIPPNIVHEDNTHLMEIFELYNARDVYILDRILSIMLTVGIEDQKIIVFYFSNYKCYRVTYFSQGIYYLSELEYNLNSLSNSIFNDYISEMKNTIVEFPDDFTIYRKNKIVLYNELFKLWKKDFHNTIHIILESSMSIPKYFKNYNIMIHCPNSETAIKGNKICYYNIFKK